MSFDPDGKSDEQQISTEDLLKEIIKILLRMEAHLVHITDEEIADDDVD